MESKITSEELLNLLRQNKINEVLSSLSSYVRNSDQSELVDEYMLIQSRYFQLQKKNFIGIIDFETYSKEQNKINVDLLELISRLRETQLPEQTSESIDKNTLIENAKIDLSVRLSNRSFEKYTVKELKKILNYFRDNIGDYRDLRIRDISSGSVFVTFEMSYDSAIRLISNLDRREIEKLGIDEMTLINFSEKRIELLSTETEKEEFDLRKRKIHLKNLVAKNIKKAIAEIKTILDPSSELFNELHMAYSRFNYNELNRIFNNSSEHQISYNQIVKSLIDIVDKMEYDDIDKNAA